MIETRHIRALDQVVADAIAAGEVVERPASVVKELLENAIDAAAHRVTVEIEGGGATRIMVLDDGAGIPPEELPLAFRRHATSKVATLDDLAAVATLGFRGEALASIAAVSRVTCASTVPGAGGGAAIEVVHGVAGEVRPAPPVPGTRVEVLGLFENTPARRAFLKRPATEVAAVLRVVSAAGLALPDVAIQVSIDGRRGLRLPGTGRLADALAAALPGRSGDAWLPVAAARDGLTVEGLLVQPEGMRRTRDHLHLSVNGRPVASRGLAFAVEQAYRGLAEPGLHPAGALALTVPPEEVDVNVHPTKREVRFRRERLLFSLVQRACLDALAGSSAYGGNRLLSGSAADPPRNGSALGAHGTVEAGGHVWTEPVLPVRDARVDEGRLRLLGEAAISEAAISEAATPEAATPEAATPDAATPEPARPEAAAREAAAREAATRKATTPEAATPEPAAPAQAGTATNGTAPRPLLRGPFRLVGQALDCYIVAEGPGGLVLVDQHAAHERILTNALLGRGARGATLQPLLLPEILHLTPAQHACLRDHLDDLLQAGLEVEEFGPGAARIVAHDPLLPSRRLAALAIATVDALLTEAPEDDLGRRLDRTVYTLACHAAVKFGQRLSPPEMEALLRELEVADPGITCPHGRPTLLEIGERDLRREFRRP